MLFEIRVHDLDEAAGLRREAAVLADHDAVGAAGEVVAHGNDFKPILFAQERKLKRELMAELKAERVPYEERIRLLDEVSWPKPEEEYIHEAFRLGFGLVTYQILGLPGETLASMIATLAFLARLPRSASGSHMPVRARRPRASACWNLGCTCKVRK